MKVIEFGKSKISKEGPCYVIAEIGHNHQGSLDTAMKMVRAAAECGVNAVKFQKRNNKTLYTSEMYNRLYDNENSYGRTYGEHREYLEFGWDEYVALKDYAEKLGLEFMATPFDFDSVDFLEELGITSYKLASGDITNLPLIRYVAQMGKPLFLSTGAASMDEIRMAYEAARRYTDKICLLHCVSGYPVDYEYLNLRFIETLKSEFPDALVGYSGHDNGILAPTIAYMLGAVVIEKHFTLNRAWKGTDHKFSLEPQGLRKLVRDLRRLDVMLGDGVKKICEFEWQARKKMGKSIYAARDIAKGKELSLDDLCLKSPGGGLPPYVLDKLIGKRVLIDLKKEDMIDFDMIEGEALDVQRVVGKNKIDNI